MTTIVMNTLNSAVTEYNWSFQSITPTHAGSATGIYLLGGDIDDTANIDARVVTGLTEWGSSLKKFVGMVYFALVGEGYGTLIVQTPDDEYAYDFPVRSSGQSREKPGRGIRENYLAFGFSNIDGADFRMDRIEVLIKESTTRRV